MGYITKQNNISLQIMQILLPIFAIFAIQGCSGLTTAQLNKVIRKSRSTVTSALATMVRLSFHDCVGGCDGCVNIENDTNNGLADLIAALDLVYTDNKFGDIPLSR